MKNLVFPDYDHSLLNITQSILKHYHVNISYSTIEELDRRLKKQPRNVVYVLIDGLGTEILKKHPREAAFLISKQRDILTTVFPSTTTSATVSAMTGLPPMTTSWIGWQQFIQEEGRHVIFFQNKDYYDENYQFDYDVANRYAKLTYHYDLIKQKNPDVNVHEIFPAFRQEHHDTIAKQVKTCLRLLDDQEKHFVYLYWNHVDSLLHEFGTQVQEVKDEIRLVNHAIKELFESVSHDTLIVVTADHGHIDVETENIFQHEELTMMLKEKPALESRATAFYVKDEYMDVFPKVFDKYYRNHFVLYKSEELLDMDIFGQGKMHPRLKAYLGDFVSIAIDRFAFGLTNKEPHKATHAGLTKDEMLIPLILNDEMNE